MNNENLILIGAIIALLIFSSVQAIQLTSIKAQITGGATAGSTAGAATLDTSGWTADEIMNYEMHGIIPARAGGSSGSPGQMVGGC